MQKCWKKKYFLWWLKKIKINQVLKFKLAFRDYNNIETLAGKEALTTIKVIVIILFLVKQEPIVLEFIPIILKGAVNFVVLLNVWLLLFFFFFWSNPQKFVKEDLVSSVQISIACFLTIVSFKSYMSKGSSMGLELKFPFFDNPSLGGAAAWYNMQSKN